MSVETQSKGRSAGPRYPGRAALLAAGLALAGAAQAADVDALQAFIASTGGNDSPLATDLGWGGSNDPCDGTWLGVQCVGGRVTEILLNSLPLDGTLPAALGDLDHLTRFEILETGLAGPVPAALALPSLANVDLRYNRLESSGDEAIDQFFTDRQLPDGSGIDWRDSQTVPPAGLQATAATLDSVTLSWTPIRYAQGTGRYEVFAGRATPLDASGTPAAHTADKAATGVTVSGLQPAHRYYFAVRTVSENAGFLHPHTLVSRLGDTVSFLTLRDTDGDGIADSEDPDADGDGIPNAEDGQGAGEGGADVDTDGDGVPDWLEPNFRDTDADGAFDVNDPDDDGDGVGTRDELGPDGYAAPTDADDDRIPDYLDADAGNAGGTADGSGDSDQDGLSDATECPRAPDCADTDGDGVPNYMDIDDDNDGLLTVNEGPDTDQDGDSVIDALEPNNLDTDGDGVKNPLDNDDDGDNALTRPEVGAGGPWHPQDADGDHIPDYLDNDVSGGGPDGTGDSDGDGLTDGQECPAAPNCPDSDNDGIPDYMDSDGDNDGVADGVDNCPTKPNPDQADSDGDGVGDACEAPSNVAGESGSRPEGAAVTGLSGGGALGPFGLILGLVLVALRRRISS